MSVIGEDGLVIPRKLRNPCLESPASRDLNRQIKWNAKAGVNVLNKTELEKALDRQRRLQVEREREEEREVEETPFDKVLKERAKRLEQIESEASCIDGCQIDEDLANQPVSERTNIFESAATKKSDLLKDSTASPKVWRQISSKNGGSKSVRDSSSSSGLQHSTKSPAVGSSHVYPAAVGSSHVYPAAVGSSPMYHSKELENRLRASKMQQSPDQQQPFKGSSQRLNPGGGGSSNRNGATKSSCGNSSCDSSKSSSPEPELFKVFAQLRTHKDDEYM